MKAFTLALCILNCFIFCQNWPQWRGPDGNAISKETGILKSWPANLKELWRIALGPGYSGISISGKYTVTMFGDNNFEYCVGLCSETGKLLWQTYVGKLYQDSNGKGPRSTPAISDNKVYLISSQGNILCLNKHNGKKVWTLDIYKKFAARKLKWGISSSPVIYKNMLLFNVGAAGASIIALDKDTGKTLWTCGEDKAAYSTPIIHKFQGVPQAIFITASKVSGISLDGKILWEFPWKTFLGNNVATPIAKDNTLIVSAGYNMGTTILEIGCKDKKWSAVKIIETRRFKTHFSSSILYQNHIFGFHNTWLQCMDIKTLKKKWKVRGFGKGSLIAIDGHLIVLGELGQLALVELNSQKYIEKGRMYPFPLSDRCLTVPSISNKRLFVRTNYEVVCFSLEDLSLSYKSDK